MRIPFKLGWGAYMTSFQSNQNLIQLLMANVTTPIEVNIRFTLEVSTLATTLDRFHTSYVRAPLLIYLVVDKPLQPLSCHTRVTGVRRERPLGDSWYFSVTTALSIFDQTWVRLPATVLTWIPRSRDKLSVAVSSWCFLKHPLANVATADDSHLANKSIMRKATARDEPASPVSSDIEARGQRGVTAWRVMEIRSNWSSLNYLGPRLCLNECIWLSCLESQREAHGVSQSPPLFADFRPCEVPAVGLSVVVSLSKKTHEKKM